MEVKYTVSAKAKCPYYWDSTAGMIRCKRYGVDDIVYHVAFARREECKRFKKTRCFSAGCKRCVLHQALQSRELSEE